MNRNIAYNSFVMVSASTCEPMDLGFGTQTWNASTNIPYYQTRDLVPGYVGRCSYCGVKHTAEERFCVGCGAPN